MPLITMVITLIVVAVLLWLVNTYIPMDGKIKKILNIVKVVVVVLWILNVFGVLDHLHSIRVSIPTVIFAPEQMLGLATPGVLRPLPAPISA